MTTLARFMPHVSSAPAVAESTPLSGRGRTARRMVGIDVARALAIIGMLAVNVGPTRPAAAAMESGDFFWWLYELPTGRASILFMVLAGVGMSLLTRRARITGAPMPLATILWRAVLLIVLALGLQMMDHQVNVILASYGVLFLCAIPLLRAPTGILALIAGAGTLVFPMLWISMQLMTGTTFRYVSPAFTDPPQTMVHSIVLTGSYPVLIWSVPFITGMILGRLDLSAHVVQRDLVFFGLAAAVIGLGTATALLQLFGPVGSEAGWDQLRTAQGHSEMPLWLLSSIGIAAVILGVCLLTQHYLKRWVPALVSAGRLAFTVYLTHLIILALVIRPAPENLAQGYLVTIGLSATLVLAAHGWWVRFGTGPAERLLSWPPRLRTSP